MRLSRYALKWVALFGVGLVSAAVLATGCGSSGGSSNNGNGNNNGNNGPIFGNNNGNNGQCTGLQCQVQTCSSGTSTSISGTVYDPAGKNPLYNVVAYIPNAKPDALTSGASCDTCNSLYSGSPVATALTDAAGKFTITNAPTGSNIPLVIQIGKWRKQYTISNVTSCQDNPQPQNFTLPRNHTDGDIPNIAISTGGADTLECLLKRIGLDTAEYGAGPDSAGRIHIFQGSPAQQHNGRGQVAPNTSPGAPASAQALWASQTDLMKYDMVILSCEGSETTGMNQQALFDYAAAGGRVFASHFHYAWFNQGPFAAGNLATWTRGSNDMGDINATIVQTFPKGVALHQWLANVKALTNDELPIQQARHNADVGAKNATSTAWIAADQSADPAGATEYFTFNTPLNAPPEKQCGRVVYSDLHVGAASNDYNGVVGTGGPGGPEVVPDGCANRDLSPQEKALEFMLFDLSSCVTPDNQPPTAPPVGVVK